ncbi:hypothetical protein GF420_12760, partial [candidate division GN15 bacterium]|nr:hypothetical protein [candidate division GN15 bacterium]
MLRRLLIAVFVIGLITAFSGTAFSDINPDGITSKEIQRGSSVVPDKALIPATHQPYQGTFRATDWADVDSYQMQSRTGVSSPDTSACYEQDYVDYAGTTFNFVWGQKGIKWAMRFDIPESHNADLVGSWFVATVISPTAEVTLEVYGDVAGVPNDADLIYTEVVTINTAGGPAWYYVPWTAPPTLEGYQNYHIAISYGTQPGDSLQFRSDDGGDPGAGGTATGTKRSSLNTGSGWVSWFDFAGDGFDPNYFLTSEQCVYYTDCYNDFGLQGTSVYLFAVPDPVWSDGSTLEGFGQRFVAEGPETLTTVRVWHYAIPAGGYYDATSTNSITVEVWPDDGTGNIDDSGAPIASETVPAGIANLFPFTGNAAEGWDLITVDMTSRPVMFGPWHVTARMTSPNPADGQLLLDVSSNLDVPSEGGSVYFSSPGAGWERSGENTTWLTESTGEEVGWDVVVTLCKDEFYNCQFQETFNAGISTGYGLPLNIAQRIQGAQVNRLDAIYWQFIDPTLFGETTPDYDQEVVVWSNSGGLPGAELFRSSTIVFGDLVPYPGWN